MYPMKQLAIDVGYRYMLNLKDLNDRSGFVVKVGTAYWPEKPPPVNHPPTASCSVGSSSMVFVGSNDSGCSHCKRSLTRTTIHSPIHGRQAAAAWTEMEPMFAGNPTVRRLERTTSQ